MTDSITITPSAHGDKLKALLANTKLPALDRQSVEDTIIKYEEWIQKLYQVDGSFDEKLRQLVDLFNEYKFQVEYNLIFCSKSNFLYRQKGQLKLDNTIIEEFLPILVQKVFPDELGTNNLTFGPATCFSSVHFDSSILSDEIGAGMKIHQKDQDFVISKKIYLQASQHNDFHEAVSEETHVAYVAAECKTNLDKTMFQEASATALDLKKSVPSAKYFLLCEWLDMTPISSSTTAIDEIIILRKAKRLSSNIRAEFSTHEGRMKNAEFYENFLQDNPFSIDSFNRFLTNIKHLLINDSEEVVLQNGYF